ncbi:hypothetical protein ID866_7806 [Astraeus odoratus]|nr:hypothetical protein ID866_7806 [Astraeus odoratus]
MVLTPRLRSHIADPSAMETDMSPEPSVSCILRKRHRSVTLEAPAEASAEASTDAKLDDLPALPKLSGPVILEVFTHKSLRLSCHATYKDNERLSVLGHYILEMITTQLLFSRTPKLSHDRMQRRALLSNEVLDTWCRLYRLRDELRYDYAFQSQLEEPEQGRLLFLAYVAAVFGERGLADVQNWIASLLQLTAKVYEGFQAIDLGDFDKRAGKRAKVEEPVVGTSALPMGTTIPAKPPVQFTMKHYNPYSSQPTPPLSVPPPLPPIPPPLPPSFAPNPLAPAQPHLAFLPLFNQTASQRGLHVEYPATFIGPAHAGKWNVTCVVNGIERGKGTGPSKQLAKEQAARAAYYAMGWAPLLFPDPGMRLRHARTAVLKHSGGYYFYFYFYY